MKTKGLYDLREERELLVIEAKNLADKPGKLTEEESSRLDKAINSIKEIDKQLSPVIDRFNDFVQPSGSTTGERWSNSDGKEPLRVLRNEADIAGFYGAKRLTSGQGAEQVGIGEFVRGVAGMRASASVQASLSEGTDTAGGYNVPYIVMPGVLRALVPASSLLQAGAGIVPVDTGGKSYTTAGIDTLPTPGWRNEGAAIAQSEPTFRAVIATPRSLAFVFKVTRELLADAPNLDEALTIVIGQAFAKELDRVGLRGSGTAPEPRGILNTVGIQAVGNGTNGAALAGYANIFTAMQNILQANAPKPTAAIMSPRSLVKLGGLVDSTGQPLAVPKMLEDVKLLCTSQIPNNLTVGSSNDCSEIYVGDFRSTYFLMREQMSIQLLKEAYASTGEIGFLCHMRCDVVNTYPAGLAVVTGVRA